MDYPSNLTDRLLLAAILLTGLAIAARLTRTLVLGWLS